VLAAAALAASLGWGVAPPAASASEPVTAVPKTMVGEQLTWLLGAVDSVPLATPVIDAHIDRSFLAAIPPRTINTVLGALAAPSAPSVVTIVSDDPLTSSLEAEVDFGGTTLEVELATDASGLIRGLELVPTYTRTSWARLDRRLVQLAPGVGLLAARVTKDGSCVPVHQVTASTPRPTASMFKLFVLGALSEQIADGRVRWDQELTVEPSLRSLGSPAGSLQYSPTGTRVTVEEAATKMISISDNTAADMLIHLVGRSAVEAQVRRWSSHAALDVPFLTTREVFLLHYVDFPALADRYLSLPPAGRQAFLSSTVDPLSLAGIVGSTAPRDITSLEWFASPDDLCRAFAGLQGLSSRPGLGPVGTVLSVNHGGLGLKATRWRSVWFKGGSEPGVLTLGYRAVTTGGQSFVVVAMLEDPTGTFPESTTLTMLSIANAAFELARS
jgi:hypothetical protein